MSLLHSNQTMYSTGLDVPACRGLNLKGSTRAIMASMVVVALLGGCLALLATNKSSTSLLATTTDRVLTKPGTEGIHTRPMPPLARTFGQRVVKGNYEVQPSQRMQTRVQAGPEEGASTNAGASDPAAADAAESTQESSGNWWKLSIVPVLAGIGAAFASAWNGGGNDEDPEATPTTRGRSIPYGDVRTQGLKSGDYFRLVFKDQATCGKDLTIIVDEGVSKEGSGPNWDITMGKVGTCQLATKNGLRLAVEDNQVKWKREGTYFEITKVADGFFFTIAPRLGVGAGAIHPGSLRHLTCRDGQLVTSSTMGSPALIQVIRRGDSVPKKVYPMDRSETPDAVPFQHLKGGAMTFGITNGSQIRLVGHDGVPSQNLDFASAGEAVGVIPEDRREMALRRVGRLSELQKQLEKVQKLSDAATTVSEVKTAVDKTKLEVNEIMEENCGTVVLYKPAGTLTFDDDQATFTQQPGPSSFFTLKKSAEGYLFYNDHTQRYLMVEGGQIYTTKEAFHIGVQNISLESTKGKLKTPGGPYAQPWDMEKRDAERAVLMTQLNKDW